MVIHIEVEHICAVNYLFCKIYRYNSNLKMKTALK